MAVLQTGGEYRQPHFVLSGVCGLGPFSSAIRNKRPITRNRPRARWALLGRGLGSLTEPNLYHIDFLFGKIHSNI
jgi:hypothetical protein